MAKASSLQLPVVFHEEISAAARRCERSVVFLVLGALKSAPALSGTPSAGEVRKPLLLTPDEDDPKDFAARMKKLAAEKGKGLTLDDAVALAWAARRTQILAWVERTGAVNEGERADDLDSGLAEAADAKTPPTRLIALAKSEYPRVRALVAAHPSAPAEALALMKNDRERIVREALLARK